MKGNAGKILMLVEDHFPEDVRVRKEALILTKAGYQVTVVALQKEGEVACEDVNGVTVYRIPQLELFRKGIPAESGVRSLMHRLLSRCGYVLEYSYFTSACFWLSIYISIKDGFDVIHLHNPPNTPFVVGAFFRLFGKKFVFDHHDLAPELYLSRYRASAGLAHKLLLMEEKLCLRCAHAVIATNESYKRIDAKRSGLKPDKIFVVRNGPDLDEHKQVAPDEQLRRLGKSILVYIGIMGPQDGIDYLLRALSHLKHDLGRTDFYSLIIGSGDALEDLKQLAGDLNLDDCVRFTGFIPKLRLLAYLSAADICLAPDPSSPLNDVSTFIKVMEYMGYGKPIVSFDLPETRYTAGESAVYVTPNDEMQFAAAIAELMDNPEERARRGMLGYQRIKDELAWPHVSKRLEEAYKSVLC